MNRRSRWLRLRDPRLWLGVGISVLTLWLALRGVDRRDLLRALGQADLWLLFGLSLPAYVAIVWLRAVRWRYLTDAVLPLPTTPLFRATAIGFLANNVFPLRLGEVVRAWFLAKETPIGTAPAFGTIVLERVIDGLVLVALALALFGTRGRGGGEALAVGVPLVIAAVLPLGAVVMLRFAPEWVVGWVRAVSRWTLPSRVGDGLEGLIRRIAEGLGSIQGGRHLGWVALHSLTIALVLSVVPLLAAFAALGLDFGSPGRTVAAAYVVLVAVSIAVALPSAPGFIGPYHLASREALTRFGIPEETALAFGTLAHAAFWLSTSLIGLLVLRSRPRGLEEFVEAAGDPSADGPPDAA